MPGVGQRVGGFSPSWLAHCVKAGVEEKGEGQQRKGERSGVTRLTKGAVESYCGKAPACGETE